MGSEGGRPRKPTYKIENIVATVNLKTEINLEKLAEKIPNAEYNPEQFPGLILRLQKPEPRVSVLVFRTGKMVCTGAKSIGELKKALKKIMRIFREAGVNVPDEPEVEVQNVVASANLYAEVDIERAAEELENTMYEPEQFPGLIYRMEDPDVVLLIFSSGKMVCTGAKNEEDVRRAVEKIYNMLKEMGLLHIPEE